LTIPTYVLLPVDFISGLTTSLGNVTGDFGQLIVLVFASMVTLVVITSAVRYVYRAIRGALS